MDFQTYLIKRKKEVDQHLRLVFDCMDETAPSLKKSMEYSVFQKGKRIRPLLFLMTVEAFNKDHRPFLPIACAIEFVHTYSLIHDDLPCMDDDDLRRGQPTNHRVFGEAIALLAGDALLTYAFKCLVQPESLSDACKIQLVQDFCRYIGPQGMISGQIGDMTAMQEITTLKQLTDIHHRKTGDLFVFSLTAGAQVAGATAEDVKAMDLFGRNLGLAFQIQDDLLDVIGDKEKIGKNTNADHELNKVTFPFFLGIDGSKKEVEKCISDAVSAINNSCIPSPNLLLKLTNYLLIRDF